MAGITDLPEAQRLIQALQSIGVQFSDPQNITEDELRLQSVTFMRQMNQLFGDPDQLVSNFDAATLAKIRAGIAEDLGTDNQHGKTQLENLQAIVRRDVDFLTEDITGRAYGLVDKQSAARNELEKIYSTNTDDSLATRKVLEFVAKHEDEEKPVSEFLASIRNHAPHILQNLPAAIDVLAKADNVFSDLETLNTQGLFSTAPDPAKLAAIDPQKELKQAVGFIEDAIGVTVDENWTESDAAKLQEFIKKEIISQPYFAQGWSGPIDGVYDADLARHLNSRVAGMPETTQQEQDDKNFAQTFFNALGVIQSRSLQVTPERLTATTATQTVETVLLGLAPLLNEKLDEAAQKTDAQLGGLKDLIGIFVDTSLLEERIPVISKADGIFDLRAQASLQGLLQVLGHKLAMDIPGENDWLYTPATGQFIKDNLGKFKKKLAGFMSEEEFEALDKELTDEKVAELITALDYLHAQGRITTDYLLDFEVVIPDYTQNLFQQRVSVGSTVEMKQLEELGAHRASNLQADNPDMLKLLDVLTQQYVGNGAGLQVLMPELEMADLQLDPAADPKNQLAEFYKLALEKHLKNGGTKQEFQNDLFILVNTVLALPYGSGQYRHAFNNAMEKAIVDASAKGSPEDAGQAFAEEVTKAAAALTEEHGPAKYRSHYERDVPVWKPGLQNFSIQSGGQQIEAQDIADAYDNYHIAQPHNGYRDRGVPDVILKHTYIDFKDDDGNIYVAAIDKKSMVFSIEKIDTEKIRAIMDASKPKGQTYDQMVDEMRAADPGFALLYPTDKGQGSLGGPIAMLLETLKSDNVPHFNEFDAVWEKHVKDVRNENHARTQSELGKIPAYMAGKVVPVDQLPQTALPNVREDLNRSAGEIKTDLNILRKFVADEMTATPRVIMPHERGWLGLLDRNAGWKLPIGNTPGSGIRVESVEMPSAPYQKPLIATYDERSHRVKVIEMPDYLLDKSTRKALRAAAMESGSSEDSQSVRALMKDIQDNKPELFAVIQEYRMYGEGRTIAQGEAATPSDAWKFDLDTIKVLDWLEKDLSSYRRDPVASADPGSLGHVFGRKATAHAGSAIGSYKDHPTQADAMRDEWEKRSRLPPTKTEEIRNEGAHITSPEPQPEADDTKTPVPGPDAPAQRQ